MRRTLSESRVLLTGASSGIGYALAEQLAAKGTDLLITARRGELLHRLVERIRGRHPEYAEGGGRKIVAETGDITDPEVRRRCVDTARERLGGIDLLVNNAGVGATALVEATSEEVLRRMMEVNYFSLVLLVQRALPHLKESARNDERQSRGIRPMIVNLGSIVGLRGVPHYGAYGAAKFAVTGIGESLRAELTRDRIDVLQVSPGTTQTEFFDSLLVASSAPEMPVHRAVSPEYVARRIVRAMERGSRRIIPYAQAVVLQTLQRLSPGLVDTILARYV
ncbi:MAG TPA: short chain dehydrogenase [Planctomycetaceae bacterium]|nr:short chain dehydrogenase [Planctomycetaceae bacterium]